jgi:molybdate transport system permease protein
VMKRGEGWAFAGWLTVGSPLVLLIVLAVLALVISTSPQAMIEQLWKEDTRQAVFLSLRTTLVATAIVAVFGTFVALAIQRSPAALASALELIITVPAIMPPSVVGLSLLLAFGRQGLLGVWLEDHGITIGFTSAAVVMAQVLVSAPFFVRELIDAARLDGADAFRVGKEIVLPLATPFLITGLILAWARALGEFGATIMFAGNMKGVTQTMPLAVYLGFESDLEQAKALAVILLLSALAGLLIVRLALGRRLTFAH